MGVRGLLGTPRGSPRGTPRALWNRFCSSVVTILFKNGQNAPEVLLFFAPGPSQPHSLPESQPHSFPASQPTLQKPQTLDLTPWGGICPLKSAPGSPPLASSLQPPLKFLGHRRAQQYQTLSKNLAPKEVSILLH